MDLLLRIYPTLFIAAVLLPIVSPQTVSAASYYVATSGNDGNNGSIESPWASISHALRQVTGGDEIIVRNGTYNNGTYTTRSFSDWVTIRAENPHHVRLTNINSNNAQTIIMIATRGSAKIAIEGFVFSNVDPSYTCPYRHPYYLVQIESAQDVRLKNNILFGNNAAGGCNELLKINRSGDPQYPKNIQIQGNVFYDPANAGGADIIDSVRPGEVDIFENIFFARNAPSAQSFITLKTETLAQNIGITPRSPRYKIYKNIFLNWDGKTDQAFIQLGEDSHAQPMITDALIENNLLIGNSSRRMAAPFQFKGPRNVTVRANTIVGNFADTSTFGFRIGTESSNPEVRDIFIYNNIWSDPTGTMGSRFINNYNQVLISSIKLDNNLFWNAGNALPTAEDPAPATDQNIIHADPMLNADHNAIVLPVYNESLHRFQSGSTTIRAEFERLVRRYGSIPSGSAAIDRANPQQMPVDDILGNSRGSNPDVGAYEYHDSSDNIAPEAPNNLRQP